jgi:hypothetical protein
VLTDEMISAWCQSTLGAPLDRVLFRRQHLPQVVGVELAGGRRVVVKIRRFEERLVGCIAVQAPLAQAGANCRAASSRSTLS